MTVAPASSNMARNAIQPAATSSAHAAGPPTDAELQTSARPGPASGGATVCGSDHGSLISCPAMAAYSSPASPTLLARGPTVSNDGARGVTPVSGIRPCGHLEPDNSAQRLHSNSAACVGADGSRNQPGADGRS